MYMEEKGLGIIFYGELKFSSHYNNRIAMKSNRALGTIKHAFVSNDANTIKLFIVCHSCSQDIGLHSDCVEPSSHEKHLIIRSWYNFIR